MDKCEWDNQAFLPCAKLRNELREDIFCVAEGDYGNFCKWCGASLKKPIKVSPGMFGTYANHKKDLNVNYGFLKGLDSDTFRFSVSIGADSFSYFK